MLKDKIKLALKIAGKNQKDFAKELDIAPQNANNKINRETMTIQDIILLAKTVGGTLSITFPDGDLIVLDENDLKEKTHDNE